MHAPQNRRAYHRVRVSGFTLIELMVTIAIAGILLTIAAPSFTTTVERWRVNQAREAFASSLYLARREAIKRGGDVKLASTCHSSDWSCGWQICAQNDCANALIQEVPALPKVVVTDKDGNASYAFDRWGSPNPAILTIDFRPVGPETNSHAASDLCMDGAGRIDSRQGKTC